MLKEKRFCTLIYCILVIIISQIVSGAKHARSYPAPTAERRVHINPPGPNESRYVYIPFEVGPRAVRIKVSYQYDRAKGTNTIDIGLFDARSTGSDSDPRGFRGWSGGRRSEFFVSQHEATPGYLSGNMRAGTWRIILGRYQVAPEGVDVTFKIEVETDNARSSSTNANLKTDSTAASTAAGDNSRLSLPQPQIGGNGMRWWRGDLHMHTVHSDGTWTIPELISSARNNGLDFIVITDHNTPSHHAEIDRLTKGLKEPLVMRGEEITTYGGHTNAWGLPSGKWIDFRTHPGDDTRIANIVAEAHRAGALISINHPFVLCGGCSWSYDATARGFDAIEVWNGPWDFTDEPALQMWDKILRSGRHITAIASTDSHRPDTPIGRPAAHVAARMLSQAELLRSIKQGRVYLTEKLVGPVMTFEAELVAGRHDRFNIGDEIQLSAPQVIRFLITSTDVPAGATVSLISNGQVARSFSARPDKQPEVIEIRCEQNAYFRVEIRDEKKNVLALTNPIYVRFRR